MGEISILLVKERGVVVIYCGEGKGVIVILLVRGRGCSYLLWRGRERNSYFIG